MLPNAASLPLSSTAALRTPFKAVFAAGGTGGHLFPAIAVAEAFSECLNGACALEFIGTADRIESIIVPKHGYPFYTIPITGVQKLLSLSTLMLPFRVVQSIMRSRAILREVQPHCVICAGAYVSYPVGIAASQLGIPLFLMESNAYPGKTIHQLASHATRIYGTFEESRARFPLSVQGKIEMSGNPIRSNLSALPSTSYARRSFGFDPDKPTIFAFGGSLGAHSINNAVEAALPAFHAAGVQVLWQTGKNFSPQAPILNNVRIMPFVDDMSAGYASADVVVCRAGATTIAELATIGKPAILVPFSLATNDHQTGNALALQDQGAAIVLTDATVKERLFASVRGLLENSKARAAMTASLATFAKPDAARTIAESILHQVYER
jgi:UDP-N-acetylglucosamine--N-acetylmuramyl-(pentapeptide) pyrophosphoryl-undecaprenol N-acetylglucosamine transferase